MTNWVLRWVISGVALAVVTNLNIGVKVDDLGSLVMATIVIGLVNSLIRPIVMLLTLPLSCLTFGLFGVIVNGVLFASTQAVVPGFHTDLLGAIVGSALMAFLTSILSGLLPDKKKK